VLNVSPFISADLLGLHGPLAVLAIVIIAFGALAVFGSMGGEE
jgi:hypothetical protein